MTEICRTCLKEIGNNSTTFRVNSAKGITVGKKLTYCIPEIDLDVVPNAVICNTCFESLTLAHEFKTKCLKTEGRIQRYIEQTGYILTCINLRDIARELDSDSSTVKQENLDIKNLQCDTKNFFDVPKIAQLLANENTASQKDDDYDQSCIHKCNKCDYRAPKRQTLIVHMRKHSMEVKSVKPYKCLMCEYKSSRKSNLQYHMQMHLNNTYKKRVKVYKCSFCEYSSTRSNSLSVHLPIHLQTGTSTNFNFYGRIRVQNTEKTLHCSYCGYKTTTKSDLQMHMRLHGFYNVIDDNNVAVNNVT